MRLGICTIFGLSGFLMFRTSLKAAPNVESSSDSPIAHVDAAILQHRHEIKNISLHIVQRVSRADKTLNSEYDYFYDGLRLRQDMKSKDGRAIQCYGDEYFYQYFAKEDGHPHVLTATDLKRANRANPSIQEPLKMMLHPLWMQAGSGFTEESFIACPQRKDLRLDDIMWEGQPAKEVSCVMTRYDGQLKYVVVPACGWSVVRMESHETTKANHQLANSVQCTLQKLKGDIWFPKSVRFRGTKNGIAELSEDLEFEVNSVNEPIALGTFQPITMNLPPKTAVARVPGDPRGTLMWDGNEIVVMPKEEHARRMAAAYHPTNSVRSRLGYLVVSAILATVAGVALWLRRRKMIASQP